MAQSFQLSGYSLQFTDHGLRQSVYSLRFYSFSSYGYVKLRSAGAYTPSSFILHPILSLPQHAQIFMHTRFVSQEVLQIMI